MAIERRQVMTAKTRACVEAALDCADKDNCPQTAAALGIILRCDGLPRPVIQTLLTMGHSALQLLGR